LIILVVDIMVPNKTSEAPNKKFMFFEKITKNKLNFNIKNKIIYTLSIFGFVVILGLMLFFISQSKKNESTITNKSILLEKRFWFSKKNH